MKDPFTFIDQGWDFGTVWGKSKSGLNNGYMVLKTPNDDSFDYYVKADLSDMTKTYGEVNPQLDNISYQGVGTENITSTEWSEKIQLTTDAGQYDYNENDLFKLNVNNSDIDEYYIDYGDGKLTINKKELSISGIAAANKEFDNTINAEILDFGTLQGVIEGDAVSFDSSQAEAFFEDVIAGQDKKVYVDNLKLVGQDKDNYYIDMQITNGKIESGTENIADTVTKDVKINDEQIENSPRNLDALDQRNEVSQTEMQLVNLSTNPGKEEGTEEVYLSELAAENQQNSSENTAEDGAQNLQIDQSEDMVDKQDDTEEEGEMETQIIRVKIDRDSLIELINGGVLLPEGVDQVFYLVQ
jgi:hypothetical protein